VSQKFIELFLLHQVTIKTRVIPSEVEDLLLDEQTADSSPALRDGNDSGFFV